jgi:hypothetical protein
MRWRSYEGHHQPKEMWGGRALLSRVLDKTLGRPTALQMFVVDFRLRARNDFPAMLNLASFAVEQPV